MNLLRRTTRRVPRRVRQPLAPPPRLNQTWALDFMTETLYDGRRVRLLTMIDEGNREGLKIVMGLSVPSRRVTRALDELVAVHGYPTAIRVDNGPEFTAQSFVDWCTAHGVAMHYIQACKPDQNAYIGSDGRLPEMDASQEIRTARSTSRPRSASIRSLQSGRATLCPRESSRARGPHAATH